MVRTVGFVVLALVLMEANAFARSFRVSQFPHGAAFGCTSCHGTAAGGGTFTPFGTSTVGALVGDGATSGQDISWALIYDQDSDADGFTNGEELGDPEGKWVIGDPDPPGPFFHPGDDSKHPASACGDGRVTPPEECDGTNLRNRTCINLGLDPGPLSCDADCQYITDQCGLVDAADVGPDAGDAGTDPPIDAPSSSDDSGCSSAGGAAAMFALFAVLGFRRRDK